MSYEILNDDLYEESNNDDKKKKPNSKKLLPFTINPLYIHGAVIFLILLGILVYLGLSISSPAESQDKTITVIGELDSFNKSFLGDMKLYSQEFTIETSTSLLEEKAKEITISNFNGSIFLENESIYFKGTAQSISYGKNNLKLQGETFQLISKKNTQISFLIPKVSLDFSQARIMLDDVLNYEFEEGNLVMENFNSTMDYDGVFSFYGKADQFKLNASKDSLLISYNK